WRRARRGSPRRRRARAARDRSSRRSGFPKSRSWLFSFRGGAHDRRAEAEVHRGGELVDQHPAEKLALAAAAAAERLAEVADQQAQHHRVELLGEPRRIARECRRIGGPLERKHGYWVDIHLHFPLENLIG